MFRKKFYVDKSTQKKFCVDKIVFCPHGRKMKYNPWLWTYSMIPIVPSKN